MPLAVILSRPDFAAAQSTRDSTAQAASTPFYLKSGDRVVFYGDSITEHRFYTMFVETFVLTRFPYWRMRFFNAGWGGDKVSGGVGRPIDVRLRRDVFAHLPTVITVMLGMNDAGWRAYDPRLFETYSQGYEYIADVLQARAPRARVTLLQPSPFDDVTRAPRFSGGYNEVLQRYGDFVTQLAQRRGFDSADLNTPVVQDLERAYKQDETTAQKIMGDRAHPSPAGHLLLAKSLLKSWHAPATVSGVEIDVKNLRRISAENTTVSRIMVSATTKDQSLVLSWTQQDKALPFPLQRDNAVMALALATSDFDESLNNQTLRVLRLGEANYQLQINGEEIGVFSARQLRDGINLALLQTPMTKQAERVYNLTLQRNRVQYAAWRHIEIPLADVNSNKYREVLRALGSMENDLILQQRTSAQPKLCTYKLTQINIGSEITSS